MAKKENTSKKTAKAKKNVEQEVVDIQEETIVENEIQEENTVIEEVAIEEEPLNNETNIEEGVLLEIEEITKEEARDSQPVMVEKNTKTIIDPFSSEIFEQQPLRAKAMQKPNFGNTKKVRLNFGEWNGSKID